MPDFERSKNRAAREAAAAKMHDGDHASEEVRLERGSKAFERLFKIQAEIEKRGGMDYRAYARELWKLTTGTDPDGSNANYRALEGGIIARLHDIPMNEMVYPHVIESLAHLIERYADFVASVSLWSTGDVDSTRYQSAKIYSSDIAQKTRANLISQFGTAEGRRLFQEKTHWEVADNKFPNIAARVSEAARGTEGPIKVVIIEDSVGNFAKAEKAIASAIGDDTRRVTVVPVWATYSREGQKARHEAEAAGTLDQFEQKKRELNAISSFEDLMDVQRFGELMQGAHVFVDFDGVVGDNVAMRDAQATAIMTSAVDAFTREFGLDRAATAQRLIGALER